MSLIVTTKEKLIVDTQKTEKLIKPSRYQKNFKRRPQGGNKKNCKKKQNNKMEIAKSLHINNYLKYE